MKIYGIVLVKNEADVIESMLLSAKEWCDKILVFDNGSTDGTWDIVKRLAQDCPSVCPYTSDGRPFRNGLRSLMFNDFRHELGPDDWWCLRLDADEFYYDNPREFLSQIPRRFRTVCKASIDYVLTKEDVETQTFEGDFAKDRNKIRHYLPQTWCELRFVRNSRRLHWTIKDKMPSPLGPIYPRQIRVQHYQFRSPQQMARRYEVRQKAKSDGCGSFHHEKGSSWQDYLQTPEGLRYDAGDGRFELDGNRNSFRKPVVEAVKAIAEFLRLY